MVSYQSYVSYLRRLSGRVGIFQDTGNRPTFCIIHERIWVNFRNQRMGICFASEIKAIVKETVKVG